VRKFSGGAELRRRRQPTVRRGPDTRNPAWPGCLSQYVFPNDYPGPCASDLPDLLEIVRRLVKPSRDQENRRAHPDRWWRFGDRQTGLYSAIQHLERVLAINCGACPHMAFAFLPSQIVYANTLRHSGVFCLWVIRRPPIPNPRRLGPLLFVVDER
jgi:hypothetical protein